MIRHDDVRFALVHDWMAVFGGAEELFRHIAEMVEGPIVTTQFNPAAYPFLKGREVRVTWLDRMPFAHSRHYLYAPVAPDAFRSIDLSEFDVLLVDSHTFAHNVRKPPGSVMLCYYHTPARSLWLPEIDKRMSGIVQRMVVKRLKRLDLDASKGPDIVLANSNTTADRIRRFYGRAVDEVIYPPVETGKWADVERVSDEEGLLIWGRLIPYKRVDLAIEAAKRTGLRLNIVGSGPLRAHLEAQAAGAANVVFHGRLPDEELKKLMGRSLATVFPPYEDFGIVPVESLAAGVPVVAYGQGGVTETVTGDCGVLVDEQSPEAFARGIEALRRRAFDPAALRAQAERFDAAVFRERYAAQVERAVAMWRGFRDVG
ncbi:MAG: glycosyltransferase [Fimbriimonadaceae bacterium]|nr:glycosyltransferase [Fimbriimonadaceae bacterium]